MKHKMGWSEETYCKVCNSFKAGTDDMCPNRDNVCLYCCNKCDLYGGCTFEGPRDSIEETTDCYADWERVNRN